MISLTKNKHPSILTIKGTPSKRLKDRVNVARQASPETDYRSRLRALASNRRLAISANMYVEDDETFGSNEKVRAQQTNTTLLSAQGIAQSVMDFEVRMGGEIRVEFHVSGSLVDARGNIVLDAQLLLFEGASENTNDLDGQRQFQLYIPAGAVVSHFVRVNNDDEGGDYATVRMTISNTAA